MPTSSKKFKESWLEESLEILPRFTRSSLPLMFLEEAGIGSDYI